MRFPPPLLLLVALTPRFTAGYRPVPATRPWKTTVASSVCLSGHVSPYPPPTGGIKAAPAPCLNAMYHVVIPVACRSLVSLSLTLPRGQARCIAAKCPRTARTACFLAGGLLLVVALPFGVLGALARRHYGPDSPYAAFEVDSCSQPLGRPSCAQWLPEENTAVFMTLWEQVGG